MDLAPLELVPLATARLRLEPVTAEMARAVLAGDMSVLAAAGLTAAEGWPHEDNLPSRRVLEKAGFAYTGIEDGEAVYERDASAS